MATREQVRLMQTQQPFRPFTVCTNSGTTLTVTHPELVACSIDGREMHLFDAEGLHLLETLCIEEIKPTDATPAPPRRNGE